MKYLQIGGIILAHLAESTGMRLNKKHDMEVIAGPPNSDLTVVEQRGIPVFVVPTLLKNT